MKKLLILVLILQLTATATYGQKSSLIVLGDLHYDLLSDHDMEWLKTKPDDLRQVTREYTVYTEKHWDDFMKVLRLKAESLKPPAKAVVQLGDLSEGLAGNEEKAKQMASNTMKAIEETKIPNPVPYDHRLWPLPGRSKS